MDKKSFARYLIELVIVIVGVTIAFWLNTKAETSKENMILSNYYNELLSDLDDDRNTLNQSIRRNELKLTDMITALQLYQNKEPSRDSIFKYSKLVGNYNFFDPQDITYRSMISSGDLKLINDFQLKRKLVSLYDTYKVIDDFQNNHLQALDENYFPKYVKMVDYVEDKVLEPIEADILIKNYFAFSANELSTHIKFYERALEKNSQLDSLIRTKM